MATEPIPGNTPMSSADESSDEACEEVGRLKTDRKAVKNAGYEFHRMRSLLQTPWPGWKLNLQPYLEEEIREQRAGDSAAERQTPIERGDGPKKKNHDQEG